MRIRVAYDISFLASFFNQPGGQSGVYRTVEQLLFALARRDDVEVTAMAICGQDPLLDITNSSLYVLNRKDKLACQFDPALEGRFGLSEFYLRAFGHPSAKNSGPPEIVMQAERYSKARHLFRRFVRKTDRPRHVFDRRRYDVFHSPFFRLPSNAQLGGIPKVQTVFDLICQRNPELMPPGVVALAHKIFAGIDFERDCVTCISEFTKRDFCEFTGMSPERVFVTPLAAAGHFRPVSDSDRITAARSKYGIPEGEYFLTLGALQPRKNFLHLIRCFYRLLSEHPELSVNLVIVGATAWMYDEILSAGANELRRRVVFTGFVPDEDLSSIYGGARAFVFPSLYEGFGLPPLEAMQCGTPVIASNTTAIPEVVGDAGLLVDPRDTDSLCQSMLELLTNEELRNRLSQKGLERSKEFSWAKCAAKTVAAYRMAAGDA